MALGDGVSAIAMLGVTFGGFSPTAMDGVAASKEMVIRSEKARAQQREAEKRRREIERARASAPKRYTDENGCIWTYVIMDDAFVRIDSCKRECECITIPDQIDEKPVRAIGSDVFHESDRVREIVCPDTVEAIGACAFRALPQLKRLVFPSGMSTLSRSWIQRCTSLEEMVLPDLLDELTSAVFENASLKTLYVGSALRTVKPGACEKTNLENFVVSDSNPFVWTDGNALYTKDKRVLLALVRPVASYAVNEECVVLSKKACMGIGSLESIELPENLEVIGEYAFAHTGLRTVDIPASVAAIQTRAFFHCLNLETVVLHEGLVELGESAFADSGLTALHLPASIQTIGASVTTGSNVVHSGEGVTFSIDPASETFYFDGEGGLYRKQEDGLHFIQLIDREETEYRVIDGTRYIDEYAFAFQSNIESVVLPEGLLEIRKNAFRVCGRLRHVHFPESLKLIGQEAFIDTSLESLYLPAGFESLSDDALMTAGAHRLGEPPSLRTITVHEDNPRFYVQSGLLCRRGTAGDRGIVFNDDEAHVVIPEQVTTIADHAFANARNIETFSVGPQLNTIGTAGFSTWSRIRLIHAEVANPIEGRTVFDIRFPDTPRAVHEISISLGGSAWVNVPEIMRHYDNCLAHAHDYNMRDDSDGISAYDQVRLMLDRFKDPILLAPVNKSMFERIIREHIVDICRDVARHDDRACIDDLCDFGFVHGDNLEMIIVEVGSLQDAAMSGYLLELKRRRFGRAAFDFDL